MTSSKVFFLEVIKLCLKSHILCFSAQNDIFINDILKVFSLAVKSKDAKRDGVKPLL